MKQRIITGIVLALVLVPLFLIEILFPAFYGLMIAMTGLAAYELLSMFSKEEPMNPFLMITTILSTVLFYLTIVFSSNLPILDGYSKYIFNINPNVVLLAIGFILLMMIVFIPKNSMKSIAHSFTTVFYIGLGFASLTILRMMGIRFIVFVLLITILTDVFAYFFGVKFGKTKMSPNISPNKSYEGAISGTVIATVVASLFAIFYSVFKGSLNPDNLSTIFEGTSSIGSLSKGIQASIIIPITLVGSVIGQIGDLVASKFKRTYDIKDFGSIFPGHGGVLDRFDSAIFTAMFIVLVLTAVQLIFPL